MGARRTRVKKSIIKKFIVTAVVLVGFVIAMPAKNLQAQNPEIMEFDTFCINLPFGGGVCLKCSMPTTGAPDYDAISGELAF